MAAAVDHKNPVVLVVLDGWGYRPEREGNAVLMADTPNWDRLWAGVPRTLLDASGLAVGNGSMIKDCVATNNATGFFCNTHESHK